MFISRRTLLQGAGSVALAQALPTRAQADLVNSFVGTLNYPTGATPGFDPNHPASVGLISRGGFTCVAQGGNFVNLITGAEGTVTGTVTASSSGLLGPATLVGGGGANNAVSFSNPFNLRDPTATVAAMVFLPSINTNTSVLFCNSTTATGLAFFMAANTGVMALSGQGATGGTSTAVAFSANIPYFVVGSRSGDAGVVNYFLMRLDTGRVAYDTQTASTLSASTPAGTFCVGNTPASVRSFGGRIAALMFVPTYMTLSAIGQWAQNPWGFWYPSR